MRAARRALGWNRSVPPLSCLSLVTALCLTGCPRSGPTPPAPSSKTKPPLVSPNTSKPAPSASEPLHATPLATADATPKRAPTALAPERLVLGTQARPWPGVTLGLKGVESLPVTRRGARTEEQAALVSLGVGQLYLPFDVFAKEQIPLGGALLEVLAIEEASLRFRWLRAPEGASPPKIREVKGPRFAELGLYRFSDGTTLGVGKVATLARRDGTPVRVVSFSLFPPGYEQNPLQDYELLPRLVAGKRITARTIMGRQLTLAKLEPARGGAPGWVRLAH